MEEGRKGEEGWVASDDLWLISSFIWSQASMSAGRMKVYMVAVRILPSGDGRVGRGRAVCRAA